MDDEKGTSPFIMIAEGVGRLYALTMKDGPFPEHYEPMESPAKNLLSKVQHNPWSKSPRTLPATQSIPVYRTTYRVTEHWQTAP